jgi:hypothetical protein
LVAFVWCMHTTDRKLLIVFVRFSCAASRDTELRVQEPLQIITEKINIYELSEINRNESRIKHRNDL